MSYQHKQQIIPLSAEKETPSFVSLTEVPASSLEKQPAQPAAPVKVRAGRTLSFVNSKGGVGKTTTTVNVAAALSIRTPVLLVDLDPQGSATRALGRRAEAPEASIASVLRGQASVADAVCPSDVPGLDYVTAGVSLVPLQEELARRDHPHRLLDEALEAVRDRYGFILIDCPPTFGILSRNALVASDGYFVPVQPHYLAMEGMQSLVRTLELTNDFDAPYPAMLGIILSMVDDRDPSTRDNVQHLRYCYPDHVLHTEVPFDIHLAEAPARGQSIFEYAGRSLAARSYWNLSKELRTRARDANRHAEGDGYCTWG